MSDIDTTKWRTCAPLLPDGGCEAVRQLCDAIDELRSTITRLTKERDGAEHERHEAADHAAACVAAFVEAKAARWRIVDIIAAIRSGEWKEPKP